MTDSNIEQSYAGQTVLITGGAGGFGRSASQMFAERGANLVLSDFDADGLAEHEAALTDKGYEVATLTGTVAAEDHCMETVELALERFGRLDVAINNAGMSHDAARITEIDSEQAQATIQIDLMGVFYGMKYQLQAMQKAFKDEGRQSNILNIASLAGLVGAPTIGVYAAAKHGVVGLTKTAALEYARRGVRVNALCPAFARTPLVEHGVLGNTGGDKEAEDHLTRGVPMRRLAEPEEVTQAMVWICNAKNSFMTGETIAIDGGTNAM